MLKSKFEVLAQLGKGTYGSVFKAKRRADGLVYAVKKVVLGALKTKDRQNSVNEVRLLASINSPFVISYKESFFDDEDKSLYIVMEYADKGDLMKAIESKKRNRDKFTETQVWLCAGHILAGLRDLHALKVLHRDLKSANIFLQGGLYKIGDFNVSKVLKDKLAHTQTGTPYYASPQIWKDLPYSWKCDLWSVGCILYEMCALRPPFMANSMEQLSKKVQKGFFQRIPMRYSQQLFDFIASMLKVKPQDRPEIESLLSNANIPRFSTESQTQNLLGTIKIPKKLISLRDRLPHQNYGSNPKLVYDISLPPITKRSLDPKSISPQLVRKSRPSKSIITEQGQPKNQDQKSQWSVSRSGPRKCLSKDERLFVLQPKVLEGQPRRNSVLRTKLQHLVGVKGKADYEYELFGRKESQQNKPDSRGYEMRPPEWWG